MHTLLRPYSVVGSEAHSKRSRGQASYVFEGTGRAYLDGAAGLWNVALGLGQKQVLACMQRQLECLSYAPLFDGSHAPAEALSDRLVKLSEGRIQSAYLSTTGSTAVEVALTVALLHHQAKGNKGKRRIVSYDRGYHGCSYLARAASGILDQELSTWDLALPEFLRIPAPSDEAASLEALARLLAEQHEQVACVLVEPVLGSAGVVVPSKSYGIALSRLCQDHDVLLIADEVATGGGRCGAFFSSQLLGLEPDVITLAKGLTAGYYPLAATLFSERTLEPLIRRQAPLPFGSTQDGNPVGCAAALATIDLVMSEGLLGRAADLGEHLCHKLGTLVGESAVSAVRGLGLMVGIELVHRASGKPFTEAQSAEVREACREEGLLVYHFDSGISLFPPLTITDDEATEMIEIITYVLSNLS